MVEAEASDPDYIISMPAAKCQAEDVISRLETEMAEADADLGTSIELLISYSLNNYFLAKSNATLVISIVSIQYAVSNLVDLTKPNAAEIEFTRRQADELIKAFGVLSSTLNQFKELMVLSSTLNQFKELIKDGECKEISRMNPMAL
ncbi:uncharacterized protein A4U43_C01F27410 [Asparagus officinalis]|uniref:Uncharacterized protein n=1 Tax=Asparagus officinalis TaxID=4686 RepID=A0A5P1FSJ8_ASPOF|nr:uncharacterized protein A4U43_C01F27410 [Asparagus officinalis]